MTWARLKLLSFIIAALAMGWVVADAIDWHPTNTRALPTITELAAATSANSEISVVERLETTPARSEAAVDLIVDCLMHDNRELRQAARSVAHKRLDQWQLTNAAHEQRLATRLSGSLRRLLELPSGAPTNRELTIEAREIATRIFTTANRSYFTDSRRCLDDCQAVLSYAPPAKPPARLPDVLQDGLRNALIAPASYEAEVSR